MVEVGKRYYFLVHAYHHFLGEVVEVIGRKEVVLKNVVRVQGSTKNWTDFFRDGCTADDSTLTFWPDGTTLSGWFAAVPWPHPIPGAPGRETQRRTR